MALEGINGVAASSVQGVNSVAKSDIEGINATAVTTAAAHSDLWVLAANDGRVGYSTDAQNWTIGAGQGGGTDLFAVAFANTGSYGDGLWVFARNASSAEVAYQTDNPPVSTRDTVNLDGSRGARAIHYDRGGQKFMIGAKSLSSAKSIMTSSFGPDSNDTAAGVWSASASASDYSDATSNYGLFQHDSIGSNGAGVWMVGITDDLIVSTDNGDNWSLVSGSNFFAGGNDVKSVNYANGVWLVAGESAKLKRTADNGVTWTDQDSQFGSNTIVAMAFGGAGDSVANVWMAVGGGPLMSRSTDNGITWTAIDPGHSTTLNAIASNGSGSWVAVGNSGKLGYSTDDGSTWTFATASSGTGVNLRGVAINRMLPLDVG